MFFRGSKSRSLEEYPKNRRSSKQAAATRGRQHGRFPTKRRVSNLLVFREEMPMVITFRCNHKRGRVGNCTAILPLSLLLNGSFLISYANVPLVSCCGTACLPPPPPPNMPPIQPNIPFLAIARTPISAPVFIHSCICCF